MSHASDPTGETDPRIQGLPDPAHESDPIELFEAWFLAAGAAGAPMPEAVTLATADARGAPSARMVLLKGVDHRGFVFFTNYGSRKALELEENPRAALCFHWPELERQVRAAGSVSRISAEESDDYYHSRPMGSRLGAWASRQSTVLDDRSLLEARLAEVTERFGGDPPRPDFWGGYRIEPHAIEFWQGRADRLHDRLVFQRSGDHWDCERLYP